MKFLFLTLVLVLNINIASASEYSDLMERLNNQIISLEESMKGPEIFMQEVPWNIYEKRDTAFWAAVADAYSFLMQKNQSNRYYFMYSAVEASALPHAKRTLALKAWLGKENKKVYSLGLSYDFYDSWKVKVKNIEAAISALETPLPRVPVKSNARGIILENKNFLADLKKDLKSYGTKQLAAAAKNSKPEMSRTKQTSNFKSSHYAAIVLAAMVFLTLGLLYPRKPKVIKVRVKEKRPAGSAELTSHSIPINTQNASHREASLNFEGVNVEEECRKMIEENNHLISVADLKIHPTSRSPFKTTVDAPKEKINEALQWLLKGAIAVANTTGNKASHMEWKCSENEGRVSVEFVLHGIECDQKTLYLNAIMDAEGSASAHFGRTETAMTGHLPVVAFKSGNKRTTISLGLESYSGHLNH